MNFIEDASAPLLPKSSPTLVRVSRPLESRWHCSPVVIFKSQESCDRAYGQTRPPPPPPLNYWVSQGQMVLGGVERPRELRHMVHLEGIRSSDSAEESD